MMSLSLTAPARAPAAAPAVIDACVHHHGGGLYVAARCAPSDHRVSWNMTGPTGRQGPEGSQGPQGPHGEPGPSYSAGTDLTLAGTTFSLDPTFLADITQGCGPGQALQKLSITSSAPVCAAITGGGAGGTVTQLGQGAGITLSPNPITTDGTIAANFSSVQARVTGTPCATGQAVTAIAQSGAATCTSVGGGGGGTITGVTVGTGLAGGGSTGNVTLSLANPITLTGSSSTIISGVNSGSGSGVEGDSNGGIGVDGVNTGAGDGVHGVTGAPGFAGVSGVNTTTGAGAHSYGGYFQAPSSIGQGVHASGGSVGVAADGGSVGVSATGAVGIDGDSPNPNGTGVIGTADGWGGVGAYGISHASGGVGVEGESVGGDAIRGISDAAGYSGIYGANDSTGGGYAGYFNGKVNITGNLTVAGSISAGTKDFKIDDPADPANKFLIHPSVESPDAENIYNGNITTDRNGYATIHLPSYFDAENTSPRYQLTVIGSFARAIVWRTERNNSFVIRTDRRRVEVSWQITAIRNDPYARSQRGPAEQPKPANERGRYLYPQGYGKPARLAIGRATGPSTRSQETTGG
jgi:hypothetical protein